MKTLIAFMFIFGQQVFAANLPILVGQYNFEPQRLGLMQKRHEVVIRVQNEVSRNYFNQLRSSGYGCQSAANATFVCKKIDSSLPENVNVRQAVINKFKTSQVYFEAPLSDYFLVNDAPAVKEYQAQQFSQMGQLRFDRTSVIVLDNIVKVKLSKQGTSNVTYFNILADGLLGAVTQVSQTSRPSQTFISQETYIYLYELVYLRE